MLAVELIADRVLSLGVANKPSCTFNLQGGKISCHVVNEP